MKRTLSLLFTALFVLVALAGCGNAAADSPSVAGASGSNGASSSTGETGDRLNVVATIFPPYDFVREIAGDKVDLTMLLPPGAESHSFEPSPQDIILIQNCDVFLYAGGDSDAWITDILGSMDTSGMTILSMIEMVEAKPEEIVEGMEHDHDHGEHGHEIDPDKVKDRPLSDWNGEWATIEGALAAGALDEYVASQAEENDTTAQDQRAQYENAWKTDYPTLKVEDARVAFAGTEGEVSATYTYEGFEVVENDHGTAVWYGYTKVEGDEAAPVRLVFNDHGDGNPVEEDEHEEHEEHAVAHTHLRYGNEPLAEMAALTDWTPFYFVAAATPEEVAAALSGHSHSDEEEHGHEEVELDEHVWTSPKNAKLIVQAIAGAISGLDEANAPEYAKNAAAYEEKLDTLDAGFAEAVAAGQRKPLIFGDRFPFRYFADAYGLEYYAAFPGCSTEAEPSAATIAFLIDKVAEEQVPVVFTIEMSNGRMADTICADTGATKRQMHSCHNVTKAEMDGGASYLSLMTQNIEVLKEALQ